MNRRRCIEGYRRGAAYDDRVRVDHAGMLSDKLHVGVRRRIRLRNDDNIGHAQHRLSRVMARLVAGP